MRWIRLTLRVQPLHLIEFLGRDLRQVPDEQNQAPGLGGSVRSVEGWHAAQTNSIVNCVVELTIALVLRPGCAQVGRFRIEALAEHRVAPTLIRMARGAMKGEMLHASPNVLRRRRDGIAKLPIRRWHGQFACRCGGEHLKRWWVVNGADSSSAGHTAG